MKKLFSLIYSTKTTLWLLIIFTVAMAVATFVEDQYDTDTAFRTIYKAKWFELVMVLLALNFIGNIKKYNLLSKEKFAGFLFHIAFVIMIIGAGITRYIGFEGIMQIREGQSSDFIYMDDTELKILITDGVQEYRNSLPVYTAGSNDRVSIETKKNGIVDISYKNYIPNVIETVVENIEDGTNIIELRVSSHGRNEILFIAEGEMKIIGEHHPLSYNNDEKEDALKLIGTDGTLFLTSPIDLIAIGNLGSPEYEIPGNSLAEVKEGIHYMPKSEDGIALKYIRTYRNAKRQLVQGTENQSTFSAIMMNVVYKGEKHEIPVFVGPDGTSDYQDANIKGLSLSMSYGNREIKLPFSLHLNEFILERYPGSQSPSSYASEVTIIDNRNNYRQDYRIFMNNVLDYDGYRFFQSSYHQDEKGTVLSVNHDFWGTWVTYFGYFLMTLGFIWTLFNKNSRFLALGKNIQSLRKIRKAGIMTIALIFGATGFSVSHAQVQKPVSKEHAEKFGQLIVQTYDGRSEPVHTLAYDVMHKISRKDEFIVPGKGKMDAMQVFIDMILDGEFWKEQKIIYIKEKSVGNILGIEGKYASFHDFFNQNQGFKLSEVAENAFRKKQSEHNPFDKEIIKVSERLEILMMVAQGNLLKLFPEQASTSTHWISWDNPQAIVPLQGTLQIINDDLQLPELNYNNLLGAYFKEAYIARESGDYSKAERIIGFIESIQRQSNISEQIPSRTQVKYEIFYNKSKIFIHLKNVYSILALVLLILAFIDNLKSKKNKIVSLLLNFFIIILGVAFIVHTYGMGLRWYLSGHAPWSNGYEALILVAWGGLLAGFSFIRYSKISLAATTLLAFFTLMTASHSSYDPQITNLQPVLKSYWLIIHVATLTISYGFLGLGFLLGIINLSLSLFKNAVNSSRINLIIKELTHINEMNLTIGLVLATVGTFLGGVWANESWGRYWGWDAKETWALIITIVYTIILHLRLVPNMRGMYLFNIGSIIGFGSVLMTFFGVNYYLSKGMHSYASGDTPVFPMWAWILIISIIALIFAVGLKEKSMKKLEND
jgi:cytochrome c-type biogenesis protein CcsB